MSDIAQAIVWTCWALVLGFTHYIGYLERKRYMQALAAYRRAMGYHHDQALAQNAWRQSVVSFLGFLRETGPPPIREMAASLIPPDITVTAVTAGRPDQPKNNVH